MNRLYEHRYLIRHNLIFVIGLCLCSYFFYHTVQGQRSYTRLMSLNSSIELSSAKLNILSAQKLEIQRKVIMLRPHSLNKDMLEERVRLVLGYRHPDEIAVIRH